MDNLNKYHSTKKQTMKYICEKTKKEIHHESFNYDNNPNEIIPLLINAINELQEKNNELQEKIILFLSAENRIKIKKPIIFK